MHVPSIAGPSTLAPSPIPLLRARERHPSGLRLRDDATLTRVRPAVYADVQQWQALAPWERYLARVHAAALHMPDAVFASESAAALLDLPVFGFRGPIHVFSATRTRSKSFGDIVVHTGQVARSVTRIEGVSMTTPLDTVVDLVRTLPPAFGPAVADAGARRYGVTAPGIRARAAEHPTTRGMRRLAWVTERIDARSESAGESVHRAVVAMCGFAPPVLQWEVMTDGVRDRVDFAWLEQGLFWEFDGMEKYSLGGRDAMSELRREKDRERRLRRHCRSLVRSDWPDTLAVAPVEAALLRAGVPRTAPRDSLMLATLPSPRRSPRETPP